MADATITTERITKSAQDLVNMAINTLGVLYNDDGKVMKRADCLPKARIVARSHISFLVSNSNGRSASYWRSVEQRIDNCY